MVISCKIRVLCCSSKGFVSVLTVPVKQLLLNMVSCVYNYSYLLIVCTLYTIVSSHVCTYSTQNATYDLRPLRISAASDRHYHLIHDADPNRNYSYYFNFCDPVHNMPLDICTNSSKRPDFAQGYCEPFSFTSQQTECPADHLTQITGNGSFCIDLSLCYIFV